ncbi:MAG TPA: hypothetical protein VJM12_03380 [Pyrinomonadaceae bacterium]|nr:hypothetical protein [Pyrinomonadaceae bacterium]
MKRFSALVLREDTRLKPGVMKETFEAKPEDFRAGAVNIKVGLQSSLSKIDTLIQATQSDEELQKPEIGLNNITQKEGARRYGIALRKLYKQRGLTEV